MSVIENRYDFTLFYDVMNGNPNGDPDNGNAPRMDPETGHGLVSDVCLKRKIRNYVELTRSNQVGFDIYVKEGVPLNHADLKACLESGIVPSGTDFAALKGLLKSLRDKDATLGLRLKEAACALYYDVRTFGAVMTTFAGNLQGSQVLGPVQIGFSRSVDRICPQHVSITRITRATEAEQKDKGDSVFGSKVIVPYALYRVDGTISAALAQKLSGPKGGGGFSYDDLEVFWEALSQMFEFDRSAARGLMSSRKLVIFQHDSTYGNAPSHKLFDLVCATRLDGVSVARSYQDYDVTVDLQNVPNGVKCEVRDM